MSFPRRGDWYCASCNYHNYRHRVVCASCSAPKTERANSSELIWTCSACRKKTDYSPHLCEECLPSRDAPIKTSFFVSLSCIRTSKVRRHSRLIAIGAAFWRIDSENRGGKLISSEIFCEPVGERSIPNFDETSFAFWSRNTATLDRIDVAAQKSSGNAAVRFVQWLHELSVEHGPFGKPDSPDFFFVAEHPAFTVSEIDAALCDRMSVALLDTFHERMAIIDPQEQFRLLTPREKERVNSMLDKKDSTWPIDQAIQTQELFFAIKQVVRERQRISIFSLVLYQNGALHTFVGRTPAECASKMRHNIDPKDVQQSLDHVGFLVRGPGYTLTTRRDWLD